ncbi:hypothetical protein C2S52_019542 [Perilla frutescens var. hirtella]|uniref:Uncharacterized protein n=1 Tax=Perilla frutescens var. hirtella TaxID=608512 RepID=A0AAD4JAE9_PERFH|nr:hypothetical protein C2S52_019542 [Perilla frutescens var. hirtella]KAH6802822.1 hypothetical protein C2S51_034268 [Perilla frutescens var. frutescens]KAH6806196.1 hypothetical protein C2S51_031027 [Perilla frutescens var. frutescens]KAH6830176.1 hypothetical protein C2S53_015559 [Perilla frutescens var. hirtella]
MGGRHQPLLDSDFSSRGGMRRIRVAEVAGGATAECAAVCCCCPCGLVNLIVLAVYKVPAGLCRKALRKQRHRRLMKKGGMPRSCSCDEEFFQLHSACSSSDSSLVGFGSLSDDSEVIELEKEMFDKFYGAGFWRSPSQKSDTSGLTAVSI